MNKEDKFILLVYLLRYCYERYIFEDIAYENISFDDLIEVLIQDYLR